MNWFQYLFIGTLVVSWVIIITTLYSLFLAKRKITITQGSCDRISRELNVAVNGAVVMGKRILDLEKKLTLLPFAPTSEHKESLKNTGASQAISGGLKADYRSNNFDKIENPLGMDPDKNPVSMFDQAKKLLKNGISERQVAKSCGLTQTEVTLMKMLMKSDSKSLFTPPNKAMASAHYASLQAEI